MRKQFLFGFFIFMAVKMQGMWPDLRHILPPVSKQLIKLHIFDYVPRDFFTLRCAKNWIITERNAPTCMVFLEKYKEDEFIIGDSESVTINMRVDSCGSVDIKYAEKLLDNPLLSLIYHWSSENKKFSLHLVGHYLDKKTVQIPVALLAPIESVALILKGQDLKDSYFYYAGMPDEQD